MKLHVGCGRRYIPGWTHVDLVRYDHVDIVASLGALPLADGCVSILYSSHALEHATRAETHGILAEWHRVLAPGGTLRVAVPDFTALAELYLEIAFQTEAIEVDRFSNPLSEALARTIGPVIGGQTGSYDFHQALFDFDSLRAQLNRVGFKDVKRYDWRATEHCHIDDFSRSYHPHMAHMPGGVLIADSRDVRGRLLSLNVEATK